MDFDKSKLIEEIVELFGNSNIPVITAVEWNPEVSNDDYSYKEENPQLVFNRFKEANGQMKNMDLTEKLLQVFKQNSNFISQNVSVARFEDSYFIRGDKLTLEFLQLFKSVELVDSNFNQLDFTDKLACELVKTTSFYLDIFHKQRIDGRSIPRPYNYITDNLLLFLFNERPARFGMRGCMCNFTYQAVKHLIQEIVKDKNASNIIWHLGTIDQSTKPICIDFLNKLKKNQDASFDYEVE